MTPHEVPETAENFLKSGLILKSCRAYKGKSKMRHSVYGGAVYFSFQKLKAKNYFWKFQGKKLHEIMFADG